MFLAGCCIALPGVWLWSRPRWSHGTLVNRSGAALRIRDTSDGLIDSPSAILFTICRLGVGYAQQAGDIFGTVGAISPHRSVTSLMFIAWSLSTDL